MAFELELCQFFVKTQVLDWKLIGLYVFPSSLCQFRGQALVVKRLLAYACFCIHEDMLAHPIGQVVAIPKLNVIRQPMWNDFLFENFIGSDFSQIKSPLIVGTRALSENVSSNKERYRKYGGLDNGFLLKGNSQGFYLPQAVCIKELAVADVQPAAADHGMGPTVTFSAFGNLE